MGFDFSKSVLTSGVTVELSLDMLQGVPVIAVEHLGESNSGFYSDQIARANRRAALGRGRERLTPEKVNEARAENRETLARHSVRHLVDVKHSDGTKADDTSIRDFVMALPDDVFDTVLVFVSNPENFRSRSIASDPKDVAKK